MNTNTFYFTLGRPFSPFYSMLMHLREICYRKGVFSSYRCPVPVISIGNLTLGGSGKTPMVEHVAGLLLKSGLQPAVVSRGYGGGAGNAVNLVSDGRDILLDAAAAGDEPRLLAEKLPGVFVLTGSVRKLPMQKAVQMGAQVIILDDGFQHLRVERDLNVVLFNTDFLAGNSRVFPGGHLREPVACLKRANAFMMTGVHEDNRGRAESFAELLTSRFPGKKVYYSRYGVLDLMNVESGEAVHPEALTALRCVGACGIARPASFSDSLAGVGMRPVEMLAFADHVVYTTGRISQIEKAVQRSGAELLIVTEKDAVKLRGLKLPVPVYALRMAAEPDDVFDTLVLDCVRQYGEQREP